METAILSGAADTLGADETGESDGGTGHAGVHVAHVPIIDIIHLIEQRDIECDRGGRLMHAAETAEGLSPSVGNRVTFFAVNGLAARVLHLAQLDHASHPRVEIQYIGTELLAYDLLHLGPIGEVIAGVQKPYGGDISHQVQFQDGLAELGTAGNGESGALERSGWKDDPVNFHRFRAAIQQPRQTAADPAGRRISPDHRTPDRGRRWC